MSDEKDERSEEEKAQDESHENTVRAAQKSLGEDQPLVSESVAADPVARNSEPYKSLLAAQDEPFPDDLKNDEDDEEA